MFPKKKRFETRLGEDFFVNAKRSYSPLFILYYQKREDNQVKATVIVPKKNVFKSIDRSNVKRKMRTAILPQLEDLNEGINLVLYLKKKITDSNRDKVFEKFDSEVSFLIKKITKKINGN